MDFWWGGYLVFWAARLKKMHTMGTEFEEIWGEI